MFGQCMQVPELTRSSGGGVGWLGQMAVKENGEAAIAALDGKEIDGRNINVRLGTSKPQPRMRSERTKLARDGAKDDDSLGNFLED